MSVTAATAASAATDQASSSKGPLPRSGRSVVSTQWGIVAASQPLAARAGVELLERGGNAVDAAVVERLVLQTTAGGWPD
jgi:gamma-glutamyltranspeptidase/glutathione hydrolase